MLTEPDWGIAKGGGTTATTTKIKCSELPPTAVVIKWVCETPESRNLRTEIRIKSLVLIASIQNGVSRPQCTFKVTSAPFLTSSEKFIFYVRIMWLDPDSFNPIRINLRGKESLSLALLLNSEGPHGAKSVEASGAYKMDSALFSTT